MPVLSEAAGLELLHKLAPETVAQYPVAIRELVSELEGLPLAIHVAGSLLQTESRLGGDIGKLMTELRQGANLLRTQPPRDMIGVARDTSSTIATLLKRSIVGLDSEARSRFALLGLFVPKPATFVLTAMAAAWDMPDLIPDARRLVDRDLLEPAGSGRFEMHARSLLETEFGRQP